jgi:hypothetical protein
MKFSCANYLKIMIKSQQDSSKKIIMKNNILFYITIISVFIKHLFTKARVAAADKNMTTMLLYLP